MLSFSRISLSFILFSFCVACGSGTSTSPETSQSLSSEPEAQSLSETQSISNEPESQSLSAAQPLSNEPEVPSLSNEPVAFGLRFVGEEWLEHISVEPEMSVEAFKFVEAKSPALLYANAIESLSSFNGKCDIGYYEYQELSNLRSEPFDVGEIARVGAGVVETIHANGDVHAEFSDHTLIYGVTGSYGWKDRHGNGKALPDDLELNVTGSEFPATFIELPNIPKFNAEQNGKLHAGDTLEWDAFENANLPMEIYMGTTTDDGSSSWGTTCITEDDGQFTIPETVERVDSLTLVRRYVEVQHLDDVVVLTLRKRSWSP